MQIDLVGILGDGPRAIGVPSDGHQTVKLPRGVVGVVSLMVIDPGGATVDLTSATVVELRVRRHSDSEENVLRKTTTGDANGIALFSIAATDTRYLDAGRYVFDVWVDDDQVVGLSAFVLEPSTRP